MHGRSLIMQEPVRNDKRESVVGMCPAFTGIKKHKKFLWFKFDIHGTPFVIPGRCFLG